MTFDPNFETKTTPLLVGLLFRLLMIGSTIYALFKLPKTTVVGRSSMSRKAIGVTLTIYFLVALASVLFIQWNAPLVNMQLYVIGGITGTTPVVRVIGTTLGVFILTGIIPMVIWAFYRFRSEKAKVPIATWGVLGVAWMAFATVASVSVQNGDYSQLASSINSMSGSDYDGFVENFRRSCTIGQRQRQDNREHGVTEE